MWLLGQALDLVIGMLVRALIALLPCFILLGRDPRAVALALLIGLVLSIRAYHAKRAHLRCIRCGWLLAKTWGRCCPQCRLKIEHSERAIFAGLAVDRCIICGNQLGAGAEGRCHECEPYFQRVAGPRSAGALYCESCGFDLRGCTECRCPECNTPFVRRLPRRRA